ncbi:DUF3145 domain-containing protein [Cryptosporangium minutisporangium]|uniref:DUF3145 domain-containing protein n=1 Tax=Cryptosporangium minutisporangium TaxID=113569 RepID=A0ABP6SXT6_9ACTN
MPARGVLYVHSCPPAVCPHVEWAVARVLGVPVNLKWTAQPADPTTLRTESQWTGSPGTAGEIATALRAWPMTRFEITEEPSPGVDGERIMHVPGRGVHRSTMSANGDIMVSEDRLRSLLATAAGPDALAHGLEKLLAAEWDLELEPYRHAGDGAPVTWLHRTG